jgi:DNA-binding CsgD family transcriptional regulator
VPLLSSDKPLYPNAPLFASSAAEWGWTAQRVSERVPEEFEQTLVRIPSFFPRGVMVTDDDECVWIKKSTRERRHCDRRLPPPEPDYVWYKWKGEEYMGYDWRRAGAKERYEREQDAREMKRARDKRRVRPGKSRGSLEFRGWRWLCPVCERAVKMLYLPLSPEEIFPQSVISASAAVSKKAASFACQACQHLSVKAGRDDYQWNVFVSYLSGGMLYGSEVNRPAWWSPRPRRNVARREADPRAARRRELLAQWLMQGWSNQRIAEELGISAGAAAQHIVRLYRHHGVRGGRKALAKALGVELAAGTVVRGAGGGCRQIAEEKQLVR